MNRDQIQLIGRSLVLGTARISDLPKLGEILLECAATAEQPAPDVSGPTAWYLPSEDGYDSQFRDHATVERCTGNPWAGWRPLYARPQSAPDVTALVEALEVMLEMVELGGFGKAYAMDIARAALAAHRRQGDEE